MMSDDNDTLSGLVRLLTRGGQYLRFHNYLLINSYQSILHFAQLLHEMTPSCK